MIPLEALAQHVSGLHLADVERWVALAWVRPDGAVGHWQFHEADVARIRLIVELRDELSVEEETLPAILSLLDQLYDARRQLRALHDALTAIPAEVSDQVLRALPQQATRR